jgi:hypothetical protein
MATSWWRRNSVLVVPSALFLVYVGTYVVAFPRLVAREASLTVIQPRTWRLCTGEWQQMLWSPLASVERACRGGDREFIFYCVARTDGTDPIEAVMAEHGLRRAWP